MMPASRTASEPRFEAPPDPPPPRPARAARLGPPLRGPVRPFVAQSLHAFAFLAAGPLAEGGEGRFEPADVPLGFPQVRRERTPQRGGDDVCSDLRQRL